jgi:hypothetical protein
MATTVNYSSLFKDVTNFLERGGSFATDQTVFEQIPRLINAAERSIMQLLKLQGEIEVLSAAVGLQAHNSVLAKPDRWRETVSINFGTGATMNSRKPLFPRSYEYANAYWPDRSQYAEPEFYADYQLTHWLIVPTPAINYPAEFLCYMQPVLLDEQNQTNFFSNYTPNLLLFETLLQATPFLKNDERIGTWQQKRDEQLASLQGQDMQRIMDRASMRTRP